ncbi:MAG: hypothetical protein RL754_380 [Bacteroidota bacterium]
MNKLMKFAGIIAIIGLFGSLVFKILHLMGAPALLLVGTIGLSIYIVLFVIKKLFL